jgi:hypothetical protein
MITRDHNLYRPCLSLRWAEYAGIPRKDGADERTRTADLLITSELLFLLSYVGTVSTTIDYIVNYPGTGERFPKSFIYEVCPMDLPVLLYRCRSR